jgi:hypothetical protein
LQVPTGTHDKSVTEEKNEEGKKESKQRGREEKKKEEAWTERRKI